MAEAMYLKGMLEPVRFIAFAVLVGLGSGPVASVADVSDPFLTRALTSNSQRGS